MHALHTDGDVLRTQSAIQKPSRQTLRKDSVVKVGDLGAATMLVNNKVDANFTTWCLSCMCVAEWFGISGRGACSLQPQAARGSPHLSFARQSFLKLEATTVLFMDQRLPTQP